uniref:LigA n=1 Tax=Parastrongyloides trichosuri TaxID=131310 RepID=A0A0N4ZCW0_PARTI
MLARHPRPVIAYGDHGVALPRLAVRRGQRQAVALGHPARHGLVQRAVDLDADLNGTARAGVFQRIVDQVLHHLGDLVPVAGHGGAAVRQFRLDRHLALARDDADRIDHVSRRPRQIDPAQRRDVLVQLDPAQRQQVGDQTPHPVGLHRHDVEEFVARLGVVLGVALQRLDEAGQRGQRRAQFMAGVGQEVDAHLLHAPHVRLVAQRQQGQGAAAPVVRLARGKRADQGAPVAFLRAAADIFHRPRQALEQGLIHGLKHARLADHRDQQPRAGPAQPKQFARRGIGQGDAAPGDIVRLAAADDEQRVVQRLEHIAQQGRIRPQVHGAAVQIGNIHRRRGRAVDQPGRQDHRGRASRQPPGQFRLHHRQHRHDQDRHAAAGARRPEPGGRRRGYG